MRKYAVKRSVQKYGQRALCVILPKIWTESEGVKKGDKLTVTISYDGYLVISKEDKKGESK